MLREHYQAPWPHLGTKCERSCRGIPQFSRDCENLKSYVKRMIFLVAQRGCFMQSPRGLCSTSLRPIICSVARVLHTLTKVGRTILTTRNGSQLCLGWQCFLRVMVPMTGLQKWFTYMTGRVVIEIKKWPAERAINVRVVSLVIVARRLISTHRNLDNLPRIQAIRYECVPCSQVLD